MSVFHNLESWKEASPRYIDAKGGIHVNQIDARKANMQIALRELASRGDFPSLLPANVKRVLQLLTYLKDDIEDFYRSGIGLYNYNPDDGEVVIVTQEIKTNKRWKVLASSSLLDKASSVRIKFITSRNEADKSNSEGETKFVTCDEGIIWQKNDNGSFFDRETGRYFGSNQEQIDYLIDHPGQVVVIDSGECP